MVISLLHLFNIKLRFLEIDAPTLLDLQQQSGGMVPATDKSNRSTRLQYWTEPWSGRRCWGTGTFALASRTEMAR